MEGTGSKGFGKHFNRLLGQSSAFYTAFNVAQVSLTWYVFTITGSSTAVGLVAIVESIAVLLVSLPVGAIIDRRNKGMLLFFSGILGFTAMLALAGISSLGGFDLYLVLGLAALWGISSEISRSSNLSSLPDLVARSLQSRANGVFRAVNSTLGSVSNAVAGGIIFAFGIVASFTFSSAAYLVSAGVSALFLFPFYRSRAAPWEPGEKGKSRMLQDLKEGFKWLISRKGFFLLTLSATFFNFFMTMTFTYFVIYVGAEFSSDSFIFGAILAALAAGDVIGSLIPGRIDLLRHTGRINILLFGGMIGLCILLMGTFPTIYVALPFTFLAGLSIGISVNVWLTAAHNIVPEAMRGRYFALDGVLVSLSPASIAAGAIVIANYGILWDFILSGVMMLVFTLVFGMMRSFWNLDGRAQPEATPLT